MQTNISIKNLSEESIIEIEGTIGIPEEWQFEHPDERVATYEKFRRMVAEISDLETARIVVNIRSTGGDVNDALLIYEALRSTGAEITTRCYGYTASAATIIAQAASEGCREVMGGALYLIHNSISAVEGNAEELAAHTDLLRKTDERLAEIYSQRSGRPAEEFALLMAENNGRGRWLSPEEVLEAGLCDTILQTPKNIKKMSKDNKKGLFNKMVQAMAEILGVEQPCATIT
jgi:ATP-dependent protease ClpP protease subunit